MPITYTKAKTAVQDPSAPPAPNGPYKLDAQDFNTVNDGVDAVTTFANGLETALADKADTADIPDVSTLATKTELTTGLAGKADTSAIPDVSDFVTDSDLTTALAGKANTADIPDVSTLATKTELTSGLAAKADTASLPDFEMVVMRTEEDLGNYAFASMVGCEYEDAPSLLQDTIDALTARIVALEGA